MIECYILCHKNDMQAADEHFHCFFDRCQSGLSTLKRVYGNLGAYDSFIRSRIMLADQIIEPAELNTLACVYQNPNPVSPEIADEISTSQRTLVRVLKKNKFHAFKIIVSQTLYLEDAIQRIEFCL